MAGLAACKFYNNCCVTVGTRAADRFTIKVPADEVSWFATRLRAELIESELALAEELPAGSGQSWRSGNGSQVGSQGA